MEINEISSRKNFSLLVERFEAKCMPEPNSGCWLWLSTVTRKGYGMFRLHRSEQRQRANRLAYAIYRGPIPAGMMVLHRCDNPGCVNPDHLFLGTAADNTNDMIGKGRWRGAPALRPRRAVV